MTAIKCKVCGSDIQLSTNKTFGTCESCGSNVTLPKIEDEQRVALFNQGNDFRRKGKFDEALTIYESIIREDEGDAEAHWCCALCRFGVEYVEDPDTYEYLPICHREYFSSFIEDVDYLAALEHSEGITRRQYQKDAAKIADVQKRVLTTSTKNGSSEAKESVQDNMAYSAEGKTNLYVQLKRGQQALEDGEWNTADRFFDRALDIDPECAEAFFGKALVSAECADAEMLIRKRLAIIVDSAMAEKLVACEPDEKRISTAIEQNSIPVYLDKSELRNLFAGGVREYSSMTNAWKIRLAAEQVFWERDKNLSRALRFAKGAFAETIRGSKERIENSIREKLEESEISDRITAEKTADDYATHLTQAESIVAAKHAEAEQNRSNEYQELCRRQKDSKTHSEFLVLAKQFAEPKFKDYQDSDIRAKECQDAAERAKAAKRKKSLVASFSAVAVLVLAVSVVLLVKNMIIPSRKYKAAEALLFAGEYESAAAAFDTLGEYKNAADMVNESYYQKAAALLAQKDFNEAAAWFAALGNYKDATDMVSESYYQKATALLEEKEYEKAATEFAELGEYKNAPDMVSESYYQQAMALLAVKDYDMAITGFTYLGEYKDASEKLGEAIEAKKQTAYSEAVSMLAAGDYNGAATAFAALGDYMDAKEKYDEAIEAKKQNAYLEAVSLLNTGDFDEAAAGFAALGDYMDAKEKHDEAIEAKKQKAYSDAVSLLELGNYDAAIDGFSALGDYKDSEDMVHKAQYQKAESLLVIGDWIGAVDYFEQCGNYRDAAVRGSRLLMRIEASRKVISTGFYHSVGLKSDGTVLAWEASRKSNYGLDYDYGQCNVSGWSNIVAVTAGYFHTVGLKSDGRVVAAGRNDDGQCNVSSWRDIMAIAAGRCHTAGVKLDGTVVAVGWNKDGQCDVSKWTNIVAVAAGAYHTVGLKSDGSVVAVGNNEYGQCRRVGDWSDIVAVAAGEGHTVGLKSDGTVVAVGDNQYGQCNIEDWSSIIAIAAGRIHTVGLKSNGTVVAVGGYENERQCDVSGWTSIAEIAAGDGRTIGLKSDGTVLAVGWNE